MSHKFPVVFVVGLSGAGKSCLGEMVSEELDFIHIEQDYPGPDIIGRLGIREEWENYLGCTSATGLARSLEKIARKSNAQGVIFTFSSLVRFSVQQIEFAESANIIVRILYGSNVDCLNSYLEREQRIKRGFGEARWHKYNDKTSELFSQKEYTRYLMPAFSAGKHRPEDSLIEEVRSLFRSLSSPA